MEYRIGHGGLVQNSTCTKEPRTRVSHRESKYAHYDEKNGFQNLLEINARNHNPFYKDKCKIQTLIVCI